MRQLLFFILIFLFKNSLGQSFYYPSINANGHSIADFVPSGWTILDSAFGDLNNDNRNDAVIILQKKDSVLLVNSDKDTVLTQPRILLILFRNSIGTALYLKEQNDSFILRNDSPNMDDPKQNGYKITDIVKTDTTLNGKNAYYISYIESDDKTNYKNLIFNAFVIKDGTLILFTSGDLDKGQYFDKFKKTFYSIKL